MHKQGGLSELEWKRWTRWTCTDRRLTYFSM